MTHEEIQKSFESCGQYLTGRDYALIKTIEKLIESKREWVGLTYDIDEDKPATQQELYNLIRKVETAHGICPSDFKE